MTTAEEIVRNAIGGRPGEIPFLSRVRLRARRRALWLQAWWSGEEDEKRLAISESEVDRILTDPTEIADMEIAFYRTNEQARELSRLIEKADEDTASHERWRALRRVFGLTQFEADLLALATSVAIDPAFGRVCAYLQDEVSATYATPLLTAAIFGWEPGAHLPADSPLMHWHLVRIPETAAYSNAPNAPWLADPQIVRWLLGEPAGAFSVTAVKRVAAGEFPQYECLFPDLLHAIHSFIAAVGKTARVEIELIGPKGSGKRTLAVQVCGELQSDMLVVDCEALLPKDISRAQMIDRIFQVVRAARLDDALVYWNNADVLDTAAREAIAGLTDLAIFGSEAPGPRLPGGSVARQTYHLGPLEQSQRRRLWHAFTRVPMPRMIGEWSLRPAEIRAAAQIADAGPDIVLAECRRMLHQNGELVTTIRCPYTWDDLVLTSSVRKQLEELSAQARLRSEVLENWGFARLCPMGRGISALFAGPSGTGKTMAAQVLARDLERELARVDLAEVMNKYIGETEKRLKRIFDACERSAVVLFFDEADALFGQRSQVREAHDRFANIQIDYLLQRMEQFDGIAILATNRKNDLDTAFLRRLRFIVDFHMPGPEERLRIWRQALAERSPEGEDLLEEIDWNWLADVLVLTGADIKSAVLAAAFLARAEGTRIRMDHLLQATRREMAKQNASWRAGDWIKKQ